MVRSLLRLEGLVGFGLSTYGYSAANGTWGWFVVLFLTPDLSMIGYAANPTHRQPHRISLALETLT